MLRYDEAPMLKDVPLDQLREAAKAAKAALAADPYKREPTCGAGRVYVCFKGRVMAKQKRVLEAAGFKVMPAPYHKGPVLYVGYDNFSGKVLAQGTLIVEAFEAHGIYASRDEQED